MIVGLYSSPHTRVRREIFGPWQNYSYQLLASRVFRFLTIFQYERCNLPSLCSPSFSVKSYQYDSVIFFCMFWLSFVCPRSHSGWIGPIGEIGAAEVECQPTYRYFIPFSPDLPLILRHRLAFLSQIVPVRWRDLIFVCFDWVLYTPGPIPAELGQLANLIWLDLRDNQLTGTPSSSPLTCLQY